MHTHNLPRTARRYDEHNHVRFPPGKEGRPFAYFVLTGGRFLYASAARLALLKVVVSLSVSGGKALNATWCPRCATGCVSRASPAVRRGADAHAAAVLCMRTGR